MAAGDVTLTRGKGFTDDFLTITDWVADGGVIASTDGDILSLSGTTAILQFTRTPIIGISSTTYPKLIVRGKGAGNIDIIVVFSDATVQTLTLTALSSSYAAFLFTITSGKTINQLKFVNQTIPGTNSFDFIFIFKETLTLPAVSQPLRHSLPRTLVELGIPSREGGVLQDIGSDSAKLEIAGTLLTTTTPNNYSGDQWWDVLVGVWLEGNWQWLTSDRVNYKYQIEELAVSQDPGRVGYYEFKMRLKKLDVLGATAQTFGATQ